MLAERVYRLMVIGSPGKGVAPGDNPGPRPVRISGMRGDPQMDCNHGTPEGPRCCALCRHQVLELHRPRRREYIPVSGDRPMPPDFRDRISRAKPRPTPEQPTLNLED